MRCRQHLLGSMRSSTPKHFIVGYVQVVALSELTRFSLYQGTNQLREEMRQIYERKRCLREQAQVAAAAHAAPGQAGKHV